MKMKLLAILLLACALTAQAQTAPAALPPAPDLKPEDLSRVVATVNGQELPLSRLAGITLAQYGDDALEALIYQELVRQEAERQGITVTQQEMDKFIKDHLPQNLDFQARKLGAKNFRDLLSNFNLTAEKAETLRRAEEVRMRASVAPELLARKLLGKEITITDAQVREEFDKRYGPRVKISQIVLKTREEADGVLKKAQNGADFAALAQQLSIDRVSARDGGMLPSMTRGSPLADAAFSLKPGEIGSVVQTNDGFHVIKLVEKIPADKTASFDPLKDKIREELMEQEMEARIGMWLDDLSRKADIKSSY